MSFGCVLVVQNQGAQRSILVKMLQRLGVREVLQADNDQQAIALLKRSGPVDILLCDLCKSFDCLGFLRTASAMAFVRAVVLSGDLPSELRLTIEQAAKVPGLELLGVLIQPLSLLQLRTLLLSFQDRGWAGKSVPTLYDIPSENDIRRGLLLGEFRAWFQPKILMTSGAIAGVEALVRWEHPARGVLLPAEFLAALVAYDLIDAMFKQLLEQGLSLLRCASDQGLKFELAFNLHTSQLVADGLIEYIERRLNHSGIPGSALLFELAENGLLNMQPKTRANLLQLSQLGCGLSIDDFGAGYCSLKQLCELPFSQIKLDGQCIHNLDDLYSKRMVDSALALSRALRMTLVIEGVSSQRLRDGLVDMGCEYGQGYYLARPMTGHHLLKWLVQSPSAREYAAK